MLHRASVTASALLRPVGNRGPPSCGVALQTGDADGVRNGKNETESSNSCPKRALRNEMHATLGVRLRAPACPQTLIFGRPKATHRPKVTHA